MSTIGFGDYVPEHPMFMMGAFIYLLFGLALTILMSPIQNSVAELVSFYAFFQYYVCVCRLGHLFSLFGKNGRLRNRFTSSSSQCLRSVLATTFQNIPCS